MQSISCSRELAEQFVEASGKPKEYLEGLEKVSQIKDQICSVLNDHLQYIGGAPKSTKTQLTKRQKEAIYNDMNELFVYLKMYYNIEWVRPDSLLSDIHLATLLIILWT